MQQIRHSGPALVEDVSDGDAFSAGFHCQHVQSRFEFVDVDVTATQVSNSTVELKRVTGVKHAPVIETCHVSGLQSGL